MIDISTTLSLVALVSGIHAIYSALELLSVRDRYGPGGLLEWEPSRLFLTNVPGLSLLEPILSRYTYVLVVRLILGPMLIATVLLETTSLMLPLVGLLAITDVFTMFRHSGGLSGAFHMSLVVNTGLTIALAAPSDSTLEFAAILFIAVQGLLGYFISGLAKVLGRDWRSGNAIHEIISTNTWGHPWVYEKVRQFPKLSAHATRAVVAFEFIFPIVLFFSVPAIYAMFALAIVMHISISLMMGVNGFLTSFTATYPAILYVSQLLPNVL